MSAGTNDVHATRELDEMITPAAAHAMLAAMEPMADDELEEVIHIQMATTEEVVEFMKQLTRYSISEGTRISDVESPHFAVSAHTQRETTHNERPHACQPAPTTFTPRVSSTR
jgi:hypothetical protein